MFRLNLLASLYLVTSIIRQSVKGQLCDSDAVGVVKDGLQLKNDDAKKIIYFSDGSNFDDEVALQLLIKSPEVQLMGIYIQDNAWAHRGPTYRNFYNTMYLHGVTDVPILSGSPYALEEEEAAEGTGRNPETDYRAVVPREHLLWTDTLWGLNVFLPQSQNYYDPLTDSYEDNSSVPLLADMVESLGVSETVTFLSVGTLTPIAKMFDILSAERLASVLSKVDGLVVMGGAVYVSGNLRTSPNNADAEFNIYNDPHGAQRAFIGLSGNGVPITIVGLDATNDVMLSEELFDDLTETPRTPEAAFIGALLERVRATSFDPDLFFETIFLWDPTAAILLFNRSAINERGSSTIPIKVITDQGVYGDEQGATRECSADEAEDDSLCATVEVVPDVDGDVVNSILLEVLQSEINSAGIPLACPGQDYAHGEVMATAVVTPWPAAALQEKGVSETNLATGAAMAVSRILDVATAGLAGSQASRANKRHRINHPEPVAGVYKTVWS